ncbi:sodium- and chloride-dependent glycine transporter 1 [Hyalella azteca]|uniref:Sodium-dependent nutrient amino acid transporter 1 n=1 Tax=Hyalella azteca TaxID=294128 RepID=A0A8B7P4G1_HYAAZ|nr:sodium- and chloride-dependent glycine transporter 1 [Hyalella azteca]
MTARQQQSFTGLTKVTKCKPNSCIGRDRMVTCSFQEIRANDLQEAEERQLLPSPLEVGIRMLDEFGNTVKLVEGPEGKQLKEVVEAADSELAPRIDPCAAIGHIPAQFDKHEIDKHIKNEVAHHSTAAIEDAGSAAQAVRRGVPRSGVAAFLFHHLHLALASPSLFRVPFLVQKHSNNNGSAFFLVYIIVVLLVGVPLYVLEVVMAQYSSLGPIHVYRCLPLFTGVGVGMLVTCFLMTMYCSVVISWSTVYITQSFYNPIPWSHCPTSRPAECTNITTSPSIEQEPQSGVLAMVNELNGTSSHLDAAIIKARYIPPDYYFMTTVSNSLYNEAAMTFGIELPFLILLVWIVVFLCIIARRRWQSGIPSWCVAVVFLVTLTIMFLAGLNLKEGDRGIHRAFGFNVTFTASELKHPTIWMDALGQVFWSLGAAIGLHIMSSSHNEYRDSIVMNCAAASITNLIVALGITLALFPYVGELFASPAVAANPGFFFVLSSLAMTKLGLPEVSSFVFYCCFNILMTHHVVSLADTVLCSLAELLKIRWRRGLRRILLGAAVCFCGFVLSLPFGSSDGIYLLTCLDAYLPWVSGGVFAVLEITAFAHLYGVDKIALHFKDMSQSKTSFTNYWKFILLPALVIVQLWAYVEGVSDPLYWIDTPTGREQLHRNVGLGLSLLPLVVAVLATIGVLFILKRDNLPLLQPLPTWGPAVVQHRKLYTQDVMRASQRVPWLVMQSHGDLLTESSRSDWIPVGYSYIPQSASYVLLSSSYLEDMEESGRKNIVHNFLKLRNQMKQQLQDADKKESCCCCCSNNRHPYSKKRKARKRNQNNINDSTAQHQKGVETQREKRNDAIMEIEEPSCFQPQTRVIISNECSTASVLRSKPTGPSRENFMTAESEIRLGNNVMLPESGTHHLELEKILMEDEEPLDEEAETRTCDEIAIMCQTNNSNQSKVRKTSEEEFELVSGLKLASARTSQARRRNGVGLPLPDTSLLPTRPQMEMYSSAQLA